MKTVGIRKPRRKKLKIALVAPLVTKISEPFLGGAQAFIADLALALSLRGHKVTLFASKDSKLAGVRIFKAHVKSGQMRLADFRKKGQAGGPADKVFFRQADEFLRFFLEIKKRGFDIVHAHAYDWPVFALGAASGVPTVHTLQLSRADDRITSTIAAIYRLTKSSGVAVDSRASARTYRKDFIPDKVIYLGTDVAKVPFSSGKREDFLLFAGRMTPEKAPHLAIKIAKAAGKKLVIAGPVYDKRYFEKVLQPLLRQERETAVYAGWLNHKELYALMNRASGLLFTSTWVEPFGLVLTEAGACGLPVVAFASGAAAEIIKHGKTGFVVPVGDVQAAAAAVGKLGKIRPQNCRRHVEKNFSLRKCVEEYERYYYQKLNL